MIEIKRNRMNILAFLIGVLLIFSSTSVVFGATQIERTYTFYPKTDKNLKYDVPKSIEKDGKTYVLSDVKYSVNDEIKVSKHVTTNNKSDFPKLITEMIEGEKIELTADEDNIKWQENTNGIKKIQEYKSRGEIPEKINATKEDDSGNSVDIVCELSNVENISRTEKFSAPAKFYAPDPAGVLYQFNGKIVTIAGSNPTWSGYQADVKDYLGLTGNTYSVTGGSWASEFVKQGDAYVRTATFSGTKSVPLYRATFTETADTATTYTADIDYKKIVATATATYEAETNIGKLIAIGAGILILIALIIAILYLIARKRRKNE